MTTSKRSNLERRFVLAGRMEKVFLRTQRRGRGSKKTPPKKCGAESLKSFSGVVVTIFQKCLLPLHCVLAHPGITLIFLINQSIFDPSVTGRPEAHNCPSRSHLGLNATSARCVHISVPEKFNCVPLQSYRQSREIQSGLSDKG